MLLLLLFFFFATYSVFGMKQNNVSFMNGVNKYDFVLADMLFLLKGARPRTK